VIPGLSSSVIVQPPILELKMLKTESE